MKIEIVTTKNEKLKETGFGTIKACQEILKSLQKNSIKNIVNISVCNDEASLNSIVNRKPDLVILAVKYILIDGEEIWLTDFFSKKEIRYTGSERNVLEFDSDKIAAKNLMKDNGIKTADFFIASPTEYLDDEDFTINYPLFLKPVSAANGNGVDEFSFVEDFPSFKNKVNELYNAYNSPALVEAYLGGREFTVSIIEKTNRDLIVSPIEIIPPQCENGIKILGGKVKKENSEELKEITDLIIKNNVKKIARDAFCALGVKGFGRIDIKMDDDGNYHFIEANLVPGMTKGSSYFPKACEIASQINYDELVSLIFEEFPNRN